MNKIRNEGPSSPDIRLALPDKEQRGKNKSGPLAGSLDRKTPPKNDIDWELLANKLEIYDINQTVQLKFSVDKASGRTVIKILDNETKEVIRVIPPEEALKVAAYIEKWTEDIIDTTA